MKFWESIPMWARGVIIILIIAAIVASFFALKKYFKKTTDEAKEEKKGSSANTVKAATNELQRLRVHENKLLRPRYSLADYKKWADQLYNAMNYAGTNETVITEVFSNMNNRADVLSLIDAYGLRQLMFFGTKQNNESTNLIQALTEENALDAARKGLKKRNVYYQL